MPLTQDIADLVHAYERSENPSTRDRGAQDLQARFEALWLRAANGLTCQANTTLGMHAGSIMRTKIFSPDHRYRISSRDPFDPFSGLLLSRVDNDGVLVGVYELCPPMRSSANRF